HPMHSEWCEISAETAAVINAAKARGSRLVAVGTTSLRTLESGAVKDRAAGDPPRVRAGSWETNLFIRPGYSFQMVDSLLTNFHLPRSTLLMLVAAFIGYDKMRATYQHAIDARYRFFSYGDAMFCPQHL
ncbi:MAG: S-adenosylmethionine:tRNA ribosyltransferase-isomerase, partial [Burkholderiaceae bacterium]